MQDIYVYKCLIDNLLRQRCKKRRSLIGTIIIVPSIFTHAKKSRSPLQPYKSSQNHCQPIKREKGKREKGKKRKGEKEKRRKREKEKKRKREKEKRRRREKREKGKKGKGEKGKRIKGKRGKKLKWP